MAAPDWDFEVVRVGLDDITVDAGERNGIVVVQPCFEVDAEASTPFEVLPAHRVSQVETIGRAFQIRTFEAQERNVAFPFIVFPELSIPAREGLERLSAELESASGCVIFVGGLEGVTSDTLDGLVTDYPPAADSERPLFTEGTFVNALVIAVKPEGGQPRWYFQAKLAPSQWESTHNMAFGRRALYFVGPRLCFVCQICSDHIGARGPVRLNATLCQRIIEIAQPNAAILDLVFIPQYNPSPTSDVFRENTQRLLHHSDRALQNDTTVVVYANKAATSQDSLEFGMSGLHCKVGRWQIPTRHVGPKGYKLLSTNNTTSAIFRTRSTAIHVATLVPASHNVCDPGNPRYPLEQARSYLVSEKDNGTQFPCLPSLQCQIGTYTEWDCLPCMIHDCLPAHLPTTDGVLHRWQGSDDRSTKIIKDHYCTLRDRVLQVSCTRLAEIINLLFFFHTDGKGNPDTWTHTVHIDAVHELAAALCVLSEYACLDLGAYIHCSARIGDRLLLAAVDGNATHHCKVLATAYLEKYDDYCRAGRGHPLLIIGLRTTGRVDPIIEEFQPNITKPKSHGPPEDVSPYEPTRFRSFVCRDDLFQEARMAPILCDYLLETLGLCDA